eukprot:SAG25_NODE_18_length_24130_cov_1260.109608_7_plen_309_part_00
MTKRKRALRSNTPQAPEAATELAQLQAEVAQLQAELQEARAHSAQQEATVQRLQLRLQALEPPRPGDAVSTPPQSTSADGSATAQSRVRDIFVQELLRSQQADSPSAGPANSWVPAVVGSFIEKMKISISHFTAKGLSPEEEAKLNSEHGRLTTPEQPARDHWNCIQNQPSGRVERASRSGGDATGIISARRETERFRGSHNPSRTGLTNLLSLTIQKVPSRCQIQMPDPDARSRRHFFNVTLQGRWQAWNRLRGSWLARNRQQASGRESYWALGQVLAARVASMHSCALLLHHPRQGCLRISMYSSK